MEREMVHSSGVGAPTVTKGSSYTLSAEVQSTTASHNNDIANIWRISFKSFTRRRSGASQRSSECYIHRRRWWCCGVAPNQSKDLLWRTCTAQPTQNNHIQSTRADFRSQRWSRFLIQNISQKCSRDDHKMTLGGLHGRGMVHSSEVGAPMIPRGQVMHHQQRCRAPQRVVSTITRLS